MVSFWPWKSDDSSPASFERALSALSGKISKKTAQLDSLRQRSRRHKALWTLYTSFAYILYSIISFLVEGWRNWGPVQYTAVAGGPVVIYAVRLVLDTLYNYRISQVSQQLQHLHRERDTTIDRLKSATKYNSTQQLLEKYGGSPRQSSPGSGGAQKRKSGQAKEKSAAAKTKDQRTGFVPPPTANIPGRNNPPSIPPFTPPQNSRGTPSQPQSSRPPSTLSPLRQQQQSPESPPGSPEFAPNAYPAPPQYSAVLDISQPRWYDRFLDLLMGEDETLPKNRYALICKQCRLVNGQAPPGTKSLEDIGKWRCAACGGWNGEQTEAKKILQEMKEQGKVPSLETEQDAVSGVIESEGEQLASPSDSEDKAVVVGKEDVEGQSFEENEGESGEDQSEGEDEPEGEEEEAPPQPRRGRSKGGAGDGAGGGRKKKK